MNNKMSLFLASFVFAMSAAAIASPDNQDIITKMGEPGGLLGKYTFLSNSDATKCKQNIELTVSHSKSDDTDTLMIFGAGETSTTQLITINNVKLTRKGGNDIDHETYSNEATPRKASNSYKDWMIVPFAPFYSARISAELSGTGDKELLKLSFGNKQQGESEKTLECVYKRL